MRKFLLVLGIILVVILGVLTYFRVYYTKSFSPEDQVKFEDGDLKITVVYNRPSKKGRVIFGELVPYGKVWRTGANEATTFETNKDLTFGDKPLKAGKYTLWTIPGEQTWTILFNAEYGQWGVGFNGEANRNPAKDVISIEAPSVSIDKEVEQFTIELKKKMEEEHELTFIWDKTVVALPFSIQ
jgi:Protein of unknown function (DUF2911)